MSDHKATVEPFDINNKTICEPFVDMIDRVYCDGDGDERSLSHGVLFGEPVKDSFDYSIEHDCDLSNIITTSVTDQFNIRPTLSKQVLKEVNEIIVSNYVNHTDTFFSSSSALRDDDTFE